VYKSESIRNGSISFIEMFILDKNYQFKKNIQNAFRHKRMEK